MNRDSLKRLAGFGLVVGSLTFIVLAWYAHLVLKRGDIYLPVLVSVAFGSCALGGVLYLTVKHYEEQRWLIPDRRYLNRSQNLIIGLIGLCFTIGSLWLLVSKTIPILGGLVGKAVLVIGIFYFSIQSLIKLKRALQQTRK